MKTNLFTIAISIIATIAVVLLGFVYYQYNTLVQSDRAFAANLSQSRDENEALGILSDHIHNIEQSKALILKSEQSNAMKFGRNARQSTNIEDRRVPWWAWSTVCGATSGQTSCYTTGATGN